MLKQTEKVNILETISGDEIAKYFVDNSEDETLDGYGAENIRKEDYALKEVSIEDVLKRDQDARKAIEGELYNKAEGEDSEAPIIISSKGQVWDGYHRLQAKIEAGDKTIQAYVGVANV